MQQPQGLLAIHLSVLLFGFTALFSKLIELSSVQINPLRSVFALLAIWGVIRLKHLSIALKTKRDYAIVILLGLFLALHWVTYFHAMQVSTIAVGVIALYTYPVITVFLEPLFHGQRPNLGDIISAVVVFIGIYLMVPAFDWGNQTLQGVFWGVLSALLFALRNIVQGRYFSGYSARVSLFYQVMVVIAILLPFAVDGVSAVTTEQWLLLLLLGVFFTALPHSLFVYGLRFQKAKTAGLIACLQVVYSMILAALVLSETPQTMTVVGGAIVVAAAVYESYFARGK